MYSFSTPQSSKTSTRFSQSSSLQASLNMSDLSNSKTFGNSSLFNSQDDSEFVQQLAASNAEIDAARYDIQLLMTKAHAYCKNSGLGNTDISLRTFPSRYDGVQTPKSTKTNFVPTNQTEFFQSTMKRPI